MTYNIQKIAQILNGKIFQNPTPNALVEHLLIDSRQVSFAHSTLFFAIESKRRDGHDFIADCYERGVRNFIISKNIHFQDFPEGNFMMVSNTLTALQQLAKYHREQFPELTVIGITGSNGKTMVKEWLFQLLNPDYYIVRSPKSYNSQIGVPLSVWQIEPHHTLAIFEAGISEMGEMEKIAPIIDCNIGVFTNIGEAHSAGIPDMETKLEEKIKLFWNSKGIIFSLDDPMVDAAISSRFQDTDMFMSSDYNDMAGLYIERVKTIGRRTKISGTLFDEPVSIYIPFSDEISIQNAIHCWAVMLFLEIENSVIQQRMLRLEPVEMRLEVKEGVNNCTVINDAYNSDLSSFGMSLTFQKQQASDGETVLFLSDIYQSGKELAELYETVAEILNHYEVDKIICIGEEIQQLKFEMTGNITYFKNTAEFLQQLNIDDFQNQTILLKGARVFQFEKIADRLSKKVHKTVLEINMSALQHNLRVYSNLLHSGTKMMAMVKASAYGSGAIEIARQLEFSKVNYLAVAYTDEGVELRKAGIQLPIMVLNPEEATFADLIENDLEPQISNLRLLHQFNEFVKANQPIFPEDIFEGKLPDIFTDFAQMVKEEMESNNKYPIHLKLDTGMHRLGFEEKNFPELLPFLKKSKDLDIISILSHLAASEAADHDKFTNNQIDQYLKLYEKIAAELNYRPIRHILNSGGIVRFPEFQMDMVRLGIGLYGIDSSSLVQDKLQTVSTLKARVSQIKNISAGDTVSYGRSGKAEKDMTIATLSIGYADGLPRAAGNGKYKVLINGQNASIFGTVCMDMCMVDVTDIADVEQGDEVIVFGENPKVEDLAAAVGTIPYEIFTGVSSRVKRVYFQE
ncbi:MAG: alanine racemase [Paraglaciecola sp.]|jgi:alanine racemase